MSGAGRIKMRLSTAVAAFIIILLAVSEQSAPLAAGDAAISIGDFRAMPASIETDKRSIQENVSLHLTISNSGNESGTVTVTVSEGGVVTASSNVTVGANGTSVVNFTWTLKGDGKHHATAEISGGAASSPASMETGCTLKYVPMITPSPWYTIPCAFLFVILPMVAIFLFFRRLGKGERPKEKAARQNGRRAERDG
jgi:hypothetical protein